MVEESSLNEWKKRIANRISAFGKTSFLYLAFGLEGLMLKKSEYRRQSSETNKGSNTLDNILQWRV